jgi:hypothetical protein
MSVSEGRKLSALYLAMADDVSAARPIASAQPTPRPATKPIDKPVIRFTTKATPKTVSQSVTKPVDSGVKAVRTKEKVNSASRRPQKKRKKSSEDEMCAEEKKAYWEVRARDEDEQRLIDLEGIRGQATDEGVMVTPDMDVDQIKALMDENRMKAFANGVPIKINPLYPYGVFVDPYAAPRREHFDEGWGGRRLA